MTGDEVPVVVRDEAAVTPDERAAYQALSERTWPLDPNFVPDPARRFVYLSRAFLYEADGALAGICSLIDRTITVDGRPERIAGLGNVAVDEARRGRGLGRHLVVAAAADARARGYEFAVLFCRPDRRAFYDRLGWRLLEGIVEYTWHGEELRRGPDRPVMALPLTPAAIGRWQGWRHARIHVGVGSW